MSVPGRGDTTLELTRGYEKLAAEGGGERTCCSPPAPGGASPPQDGAAADDLGPGLGCGDPVTLAELLPGQTVLDLGSGGGLDCFRAADLVGKEGHVIGVDMTPAMVAKARDNLTRVGAPNVEFRLGEIEHLPVRDESVDVVLSNCVLNLCPNKDLAFREAYRVLKPGGKLAVCDVLMDAPMPPSVLALLPDNGACLGGKRDVGEYTAAMERAGLVDVRVEREYFQPVQQTGSGGEGGARLVVHIGETGETVGSVNLAADVDLDTLPRSFNGKITARRPPVAGPDPSAEA